MRFTKMHGCGNDFLVFDPDGVAGLDLTNLARQTCHRRFGVGADGILVAETSEIADVRMIYYNSDGSYSEMCGNGLRCLARYARDRGAVTTDEFTVETGAGVKRVRLSGDGSSRVEMGSPEIGVRVSLHGHDFLCISMGNPHAVAFLDPDEELETLELVRIGSKVERNPIFPEGTNVEFVHVRGSGDLRMRIWERGAGETLASGSGACASAVAAIHTGRTDSSGEIPVRLDGGVVGVEWSGEESEAVYMSGPAEYICEGEFIQNTSFDRL